MRWEGLSLRDWRVARKTGDSGVGFGERERERKRSRVGSLVDDGLVGRGNAVAAKAP